MKTLAALLIATGALFTLGTPDAQAQQQASQDSSEKHWRGGYGGYGGGYGGGYNRPYFGVSIGSYYPYSSFHADPFPGYASRPYYNRYSYVPEPVYSSRPYYSYSYAPEPVYSSQSYYAPEPVYIERRVTRYVEVEPAPRPRMYYDEAPAPIARAEQAPRQERQAAAPARMERYTLSAKELFEFDRTELRMPQPRLDEIASALKQNPQINDVTITGHTDRLGSDAYNQELSQRRAEKVKQYLAAKGVEPRRLEAVGRGESQPVVDCKDKGQAALIKCLEPNRRVEVEQITIEVRPRQASVSDDRLPRPSQRPAPVYR